MQNKYHIILASNSPRRKQLLAGLDLDFEVRIMPGIEESYPQDLSTDMIPEYLACQKAAAYTIKEGELQKKKKNKRGCGSQLRGIEI